jgi:hypothetical protein
VLFRSGTLLRLRPRCTGTERDRTQNMAENDFVPKKGTYVICSRLREVACNKGVEA